jgi:hypothetical protein
MKKIKRQVRIAPAFVFDPTDRIFPKSFRRLPAVPKRLVYRMNVAGRSLDIC